MTVPEGVNTELLMKVLTKPEMSDEKSIQEAVDKDKFSDYQGGNIKIVE